MAKPWDRLEGVALVTGGGRGIGRAIALGLAERGADIVVNYSRSQADAEEVAKKAKAMGRRALALCADVGVGEEVAAMFGLIMQKFGRVDILVNNAAAMDRAHFLLIRETMWDLIIQTNLKGYFLCSQAAAQIMARQGRGRIIHISSVTQSAVTPNMAHYAAAKGGIAALSRAMALDLAPYGITVNVVAPGTIETDINRSVLRDQYFRRMKIERIPVGRFGRPEDVVGAVAFLASDKAEYITGACITVDGGLTVWSDAAPRITPDGYPLRPKQRGAPYLRRDQPVAHRRQAR